MRRIARLSLVAACCTLALASCARRDGPVPPAPPGAIPPPLAQRPALSTADYFALASSLDLVTLRSAELAQQRSADSNVQQFAAMLIAGHGGTSAQLSFAGRRLNLLPSATMLAEQQRAFDELAASQSFDASFHRLQVALHRRALELHSSYAAHGPSATLRPVAAAAAAMVKRHLAWLRDR